MSVTFDGLEYATRLEARWARFFELAGWEARVNPAPIGDLRPNLRVRFVCHHSECNGSHTVIATILPIASIAQGCGHPAFKRSMEWGVEGATWFDGYALLGESPVVSQWTMSHGSGGGTYRVDEWIEEYAALWAAATQEILAV